MGKYVTYVTEFCFPVLWRVFPGGSVSHLPVGPEMKLRLGELHRDIRVLFTPVLNNPVFILHGHILAACGHRQGMQSTEVGVSSRGLNFALDVQIP